MEKTLKEQKMNCKEIQIKIIDGTESPEIKRHLQECPECREFSEALERFIAARPEENIYTPPEHIDARIKEEARLYIEKQMNVFSTPAPRKTFFAKLPSYFAAAACGVMIAWLIVLALAQRGGKPISPRHPEHSYTMEASIPPAATDKSHISWDNLNMDEDFFNITTDIEVNYVMLTSNDDTDK